jgi:hypothetical protein
MAHGKAEVRLLGLLLYTLSLMLLSFRLHDTPDRTEYHNVSRWHLRYSVCQFAYQAESLRGGGASLQCKPWDILGW